MTRIVGGTAKGRRLGVPDRGTRPTSERAREALFNSLAGMLDLHGARVLDLFAGSGAVGLEALSRGAAEVEFVENDRRACELLQRNITAVGLCGATLHRSQAATFLVGARTDAPFDFVFADPPYALAEQSVAALLETLCTPTWLAEDAVVVVERSARGAAPVWPEGMDVIKDKRYGEGVLWYGRRR
jgi:16S rRNA (guanine966-N2)-methyltransferase